MTFLSKLGSFLVRGIAIVSGIAPMIATTLPGTSGTIATVSTDLAQIGDIIAQVEALGQALQIKGPDKLKAAGPLVAQVILKSSLLVNQKIANPDLFNQGSTKIADGMADVLNSLDANGVKTQDKTT
jgi:hypothetical protein